MGWKRIVISAMWYSSHSLLAVVAALVVTGDSMTLPWGSDRDLTKYVTRPEIRLPLFNITHKAERGITPGYWFVAPYADIRQEYQPVNYHQPCSTGPAIYDGSGELVWTGACQMRNQNACDLRVFHNEAGDEQLSVLMVGYEAGLDGTANILDSSFRFLKNFTAPVSENRINMHEWIVVKGGKSALYLTHRASKVDVSELNLHNRTRGWIAEPGFREIELATGRTLFEWFSTGRVSLTETTALPPNEEEIAGPYPQSWNFFHPNSVDKDAEGNYLMSGRFVDTIYKIDQKGDIVWRLGGKKSSFTLDGFNFSKQHDARFISKEGDIEIISFFDNARALHPGLDVPATSNYSSALVVALDTKRMVASVVKRITRPDGRRTDLRGNHQILSSGNTFVSWADNSYISEHGPDGELLLEAHWQSERFVTYRAYKYNFTAIPTEQPVVKALVYGVTPASSTTAWYASWNGATEVAEWRFYGDSNTTATADSPVLIGAVPRAGFETEFASDGYQRIVFAEAVGKNGTVLGRTASETVALPSAWRSSRSRFAMNDVVAQIPLAQLDPLHVKDEL